MTDDPAVKKPLSLNKSASFYVQAYYLGAEINPATMITGILRESAGEKRVAMLPGAASLLKKLGSEVIIEKNAGINAFSADEEYLKVEVPSFSRQEVFSR